MIEVLTLVVGDDIHTGVVLLYFFFRSAPASPSQLQLAAAGVLPEELSYDDGSLQETLTYQVVETSAGGDGIPDEFAQFFGGISDPWLLPMIIVVLVVALVSGVDYVVTWSRKAITNKRVQD